MWTLKISNIVLNFESTLVAITSAHAALLSK